jgi:hypothetical protein
MVAVTTPRAQEPLEDELPPVSTPVNATTNTAFVILCDENPSQIIVLDSNGAWMPGVRTAAISVEIGKPVAKIVCTLWDGPFRPTNPQTMNLQLSQIKSVSVDEFQDYVDKLQNDPMAVARNQ